MDSFKRLSASHRVVSFVWVFEDLASESFAAMKLYIFALRETAWEGFLCNDWNFLILQLFPCWWLSRVRGAIMDAAAMNPSVPLTRTPERHETLTASAKWGKAIVVAEVSFDWLFKKCSDLKVKIYRILDETRRKMPLEHTHVLMMLNKSCHFATSL